MPHASALRWQIAKAEYTFLGNCQPTHASSYVVQPGDSLLELGWKRVCPYWMIVQANPGLNRIPSSRRTAHHPSKDSFYPCRYRNKRILISLSNQRLTVFQDGNQIASLSSAPASIALPLNRVVSRCKPTNRTPMPQSGSYMPNFLVYTKAWPGFLTASTSAHHLEWCRFVANILGSPASYGCIILAWMRPNGSIIGLRMVSLSNSLLTKLVKRGSV